GRGRVSRAAPQAHRQGPVGRRGPRLCAKPRPARRVRGAYRPAGAPRERPWLNPRKGLARAVFGALQRRLGLAHPSLPRMKYFLYCRKSSDREDRQILGPEAQKSSDDTSQFVRRDVESKLLRGEYPGMVPPGYLNINRDGHISRARDDPEKYLLLLKTGRPLRREEIDPIDGPLVRRLFEEAA